MSSNGTVLNSFLHTIIPMFRIRDVLIRIRIRGSLPFDYRAHPVPASALFFRDFQVANKKFLLITYRRYGTLNTAVFEKSKLLRSHRTVEIKVFPIVFAC
jgi:hypothetical protein